MADQKELSNEVAETVYTMRSMGFNEDRIRDYISWIELHDFQMAFRILNHVSITTFLRKFCNMNADISLHKQTICRSGRDMNPSSCDDSIGKRVRTALQNFKNKYESLTRQEKVSFLSQRESFSNNIVVDLQDWCLDNSEILMEIGISKCWLRCDNVLAIHCYNLNNVFEVRETLFDAICVTDELLGSQLSSIIVDKSQISIHLELCGVFEPSVSEALDAAVVALANVGSKNLSDLLPVKQQMITI